MGVGLLLIQQRFFCNADIRVHEMFLKPRAGMSALRRRTPFGGGIGPAIMAAMGDMVANLSIDPGSDGG